MQDPQLYFSKESSESTIGMIAMQGAKFIAQCSRYSVQPTAVAVLSTSLCSDAGAVVWACKCACMGCRYA